MKATATLGLAIALGIAAAAAANSNPAGDHVPCQSRNALGQAFFGELHVHTATSFDAYPVGVRATPDQAYAFARGEELALPPVDAAGDSARVVRIDRPLDFAAVTDHAEMFGEMHLCTVPGAPQYDTTPCQIFRGDREVPGPGGSHPLARIFAFLNIRRAPAFCGDDLAACTTAAARVWQETQAAAERAYDRSDVCSFTSFVGYEYSLTDQGNSIHRNVIFRSDVVPDAPTSSVEAPEPYQLWSALHRDCIDAGTGCDAIAIPHNSNLGGGLVFALEEPGVSLEASRERAAQRARLERLAEIFQVKGDSECRNGLFEVLGGPDELCDFEKRRRPDSEIADCKLGTGTGGFSGAGCISRISFVRYALLEGLRQRERLGLNALRLGIVAATDTHLGLAGGVSEETYPGAMGLPDRNTELRLALGEQLEGAPAKAFPLLNNPGGLAGIWAAENTREALFDAMKRRETFGTSGPRIEPRFYAGWDLQPDLCEKPGFLERSQKGGVPMGATLYSSGAEQASPRFVLSANADPGSPRHGLERLQIVKGWIDDRGRMNQRIHEIASAEGPRSPPAQCTSDESRGRRQLCATWSDPEFDPDRSAVYYARVIQVPTCRWSTIQCESLPEAQRPEACSLQWPPRHIRERAWTSPIWIEPNAGN